MKPFAFFVRALPFLASLAAHAQAPTPQQLYERLAPSVWLVHTYGDGGKPLARGSAVVIAAETLVTNCHVLEGAKRFTVTNDNVTHEARPQYIDAERDLCQVMARNLRAPAVALGDSDTVVVGQKVYTLGNPRGLERTFSDGLVSALRRSDDQKLRRIQFSAPISHGSSGGGLFDEQGRLVGITASGFDDAQNLNFALPANWVSELAERGEAARQVASARAAASAARSARDINDVAAVPTSEGCRGDYRKFLTSRAPRAFAISTAGECAWANGAGSPHPEVSKARDPIERALDYCRSRHGKGCRIYAVDQRVVWDR
ncbi:hypothetical protein GCM10028796_22900 [Ramlibacter monticola]|uniref:S1C family serine protease n=1 Tax=Ramlibacter monticola TaxID=1926872 RepID=UPI001F399783|nr:S1C family serine protease [Ramlibacter monticola]